LLPSVVVTVIVAFPAATAVTKPLDETLATESALLLHVTVLFVALEGATVAVNVSVLPTARLVDVLFNVTPVTATGVTVTMQVAVILPSAVLTVIVALPAAMAVTNPLDETVATEVELLLHVTDLLVALEGATVALNVSVPPMVRLVDDLFRVTPVTATVAAVTVKLALNCAEILLLPVTVIVAEYVPEVRLVLGTTVKVLLPLTAILLRLVVESVKLLELVPERAMVSEPVV
jgi:hypothetical protein